jgi:hypothetical protein
MAGAAGRAMCIGSRQARALDGHALSGARQTTGRAAFNGLQPPAVVRQAWPEFMHGRLAAPESPATADPAIPEVYIHLE